MKTVSQQLGNKILSAPLNDNGPNPEMRHCSVCYQALIYFLVAGIVTSQTDGDGSSPEEICPCQTEESCAEPRHIFGRDSLDIQKFGLISPCKTNGEMPCCPDEPPPPKEVKLTAKDFEGFTPAELAELGLLNNTIGSASLPLAPQRPLFKEIPSSWRKPVDLKQPGATSLAPAGATLPDAMASSSAVPPTPMRQHEPAPARAPAPAPAPAPVPTYYPPKQPRPMYQPTAYRQPSYRPAYHQPPPYYPRPEPYYPHPAYYSPYRPPPPPPHPYYYRMH